LSLRSDSLPPVCILAGGRGTRLGKLCEGTPKPLLSVAGKPFLSHQLRLLRRHGAERIVLCVDYLAGQIEEAVGTGARFGLDVSYSRDPFEGAGTAAAVRNALPLLGNEFLVLYGDTYLRIEYGDVVSVFRARGLPGLMVVLKNAGRWGASNALYEDGLVRQYDKYAPRPEWEWIDYGLSVFRREVLLELEPEERDLGLVCTRLAERGLLAGYEASKRFYEIGTPEALRETDEFLRTQAPV
jgi:MurNAc alpha-1-phosphate uridylyltransferase